MVLGVTIIGVLALLCAVWVIYDVFVHQKKMDNTKKVIWVVCGILFSVITAIVYYFIVKKGVVI